MAALQWRPLSTSAFTASLQFQWLSSYHRCQKVISTPPPPSKVYGINLDNEDDCEMIIMMIMLTRTTLMMRMWTISMFYMTRPIVLPTCEYVESYRFALNLVWLAILFATVKACIANILVVTYLPILRYICHHNYSHLNDLDTLYVRKYLVHYFKHKQIATIYHNYLPLLCHCVIRERYRVKVIITFIYKFAIYLKDYFVKIILPFCLFCRKSTFLINNSGFPN